MSNYDTAEMNNLHYHAFNYRNAHSTEASKAFDILEDFVSRYGNSAGERWREEWSEVCNENQILHNTCDESLAFIKELTVERDQLRGELEVARAWLHEADAADKALRKELGQ
jgi:ATP-dependent helicase/DNAse subunit B